MTPAERIGADGVEAEVDVEDVEPTVVLGDPLWVQHQRWPPSARHFRAVNRNGIIEPDHRIHARRGWTNGGHTDAIREPTRRESTQLLVHDAGWFSSRLHCVVGHESSFTTTPFKSIELNRVSYDLRITLTRRRRSAAGRREARRLCPDATDMRRLDSTNILQTSLGGRDDCIGDENPRRGSRHRRRQRPPRAQPAGPRARTKCERTRRTSSKHTNDDPSDSAATAVWIQPPP